MYILNVSLAVYLLNINEHFYIQIINVFKGFN